MSSVGPAVKAAAVVLGAVALWKLFGCHCDCKCQSSASGGCKKAKPAGCCKGKGANDTGKTQIVCAEAAQPIAPYSQAIKANGMIFVSGMVGLTKDRVMVEGGTAAQARQALTNIRNVLETAGSSMDKVVKVTVLLADLADYGPVNEVYAEFFPNKPQPARAAFAVKTLPASASVEIETIALA